MHPPSPSAPRNNTPTALVAIWKPRGPTSHDVINAMRRITHERTVGHAGTLDPLASGVLVIGIGREATRRLAGVVSTTKEYRAAIRLGATSTTDDAEGTITETDTIEEPPSEDVVAVVAASFVGTIAQTPPIYSAIKIGGTPAHRRVRRGEQVVLAPRQVRIAAITILRYAWPELDLEIACGPGTYIRSLAHDIGVALHVGGYLTALERTRVGDFTKNDAITIEAFAARWSAGTFAASPS